MVSYTNLQLLSFNKLYHYNYCFFCDWHYPLYWHLLHLLLMQLLHDSVLSLGKSMQDQSPGTSAAVMLVLCFHNHLNSVTFPSLWVIVRTREDKVLSFLPQHKVGPLFLYVNFPIPIVLFPFKYGIYLLRFCFLKTCIMFAISCHNDLSLTILISHLNLCFL